MTTPLNEQLNYRDNQLHLESCSLSSVAEQVATPFTVIQKPESCKTQHGVRQHFQPMILVSTMR
ncbi:hypothetical protein [Aliamphritea spongicola]|nr:hypothetical protein [Aliamphritea spongicola]